MILPHYVFVGPTDAFGVVGMMEFLCTELLPKIRCIDLSLSYLAMVIANILLFIVIKGVGFIVVQPHDLSSLEANFDDEEIKGVVFSLPSIKAPGPDGFIGAFFKACWEIIKNDIFAAIRLMSLGGGSYLNLINTANIILIPKKPDAMSVSDYRPISLIHSLSKIFSKLLANRLAPILGNLISKNQSAFIKTRCIHDNFLYVQNLIKELHRSKTPSLFIKLDISKAFDFVN
jgi:hypothetical protein